MTTTQELIPNQKEAAERLGMTIADFKAMKQLDGFPGGPPYDLALVIEFRDSLTADAEPESDQSPPPSPEPDTTQLEPETDSSDALETPSPSPPAASEAETSEFKLSLPINLETPVGFHRFGGFRLSPVQQRGFSRLYAAARDSHLQFENGEHVDKAHHLFQWICEQAGRQA